MDNDDDKRLGVKLGPEHRAKLKALGDHWRWTQRTTLEFMIEHHHARVFGGEAPAGEPPVAASK